MVSDENQDPDKPWWLPRRRAVAIPDMLVGAGSGVALMLTDGWTQLYFLATTTMFFASALHHWLAYAAWHHRLDRSLIFVVIAVTPVLSIESIMLHSWASALYAAGLVLTGAGVIAILCGQLLYRGMLPMLGYAAPFFMGVVVLAAGASFAHPAADVLLWSGVVLYAAQAAVYSLGWPNQHTFRVVQHRVLYSAFFCHAAIPLVLEV